MNSLQYMARHFGNGALTPRSAVSNTKKQQQQQPNKDENSREIDTQPVGKILTAHIPLLFVHS